MPTVSELRRRFFDAAWLIWIGIFIVIELCGEFLTQQSIGTLSVHVWGTYYPQPVARGVFLLFWTVVGVHFATKGKRWYSDEKAVAVTGALAAIVALWNLFHRKGKAVAVADKDQDLGDALSAPWYVKLGLKLGRGGIVGWISKLFAGKPGLLRTVLALFVVAMAVLPAVGSGMGAVVGALGSYLGIAGQAVGVPVDPEKLSQAFSNWWLATLALFAVLRPVVRWVIAGWQVKLGSVTPPALKG